MNERAARAMPGVAVALLALATGAASLANGFVWDDAAMLREQAVRRLAGVVDIWLRPGTIASEGHYWPVTWTTFWLDYRLHGDWAPGWHATNVALHAGVSVMVGRTLERIGARGAWIAAALFAVHPVHAEVIGWTIARKDALAALLALAACHRWFIEEQRGRASAWPSVLLGVALLAKSSAVAAVPAIAIATWWRTGSISGAQARRLSPLVAVAVAIVAADALRYASIDPFRLGHDLATRAAAAGWALGIQTAGLAWPLDLTPIRGPYPGQIANPVGWAVLAGAGVVLGALGLAADRVGRAPAAALALFVCALVPTLGLVEFSFLRFSASADRFAYIASIGPLALAGGAAAAVLKTARRRWGAKATATGTGALGIALAALAVLSAAQAQIYRDNGTFFTHVHERNPGDAGMTFNLAKALADAGELERSVAVAREGALRHPHDARFPHREGEASRKLARHAKAEQAYRRAVALEPRRATTHLGLGYALLAQAKRAEAIAAFTDAAARSSAIAGAIAATIAKAQLELGDVEAAVATYRQGLALRPDDAVLHTNLASVLIATGRGEEARGHVERALALAPDLALARELRLKLEETTHDAR